MQPVGLGRVELKQVDSDGARKVLNRDRSELSTEVDEANRRKGRRVIGVASSGVER